MQNVLRTWLLLASMACATLHAQSTFSGIARDTIITIQRDFSKIYLLNGKRLSQPVMEWFMSDFPSAHPSIRVAGLSESLSATGYTLGSAIALTGALVYRQDNNLGGQWLRTGGILIGTGIVFGIIKRAYTKRAVRAYNQEILRLHPR